MRRGHSEVASPTRNSQVPPIHSLARSGTQHGGRPPLADGITELEAGACESTNLTAGAEMAISYQATCFVEVSINYVDRD
jgi:hypothetical protein